jgi:hypothetical protein
MFIMLQGCYRVIVIMGLIEYPILKRFHYPHFGVRAQIYAKRPLLDHDIKK